MPTTESQAQDMASLVEFILGNPLSRGALKYCTKRCKCGRRVELAMEVLAGKNPKMCASCRMSARIINFTLKSLAKKGKVKDKDLMEAVSQPFWRKGLATVLEGISEFGIQKPFTGSAPFLIVWNITKACNLACKHCYENAHVKAPDELTTEEALAAIDKLADEGLAYIAISGGEPLMRPDFFQLAQRIKDRNMALSIATNATIITKEIAKKLKDLDCLYAQVSVDGANAKTHDAFRGIDSFERTMTGIKNLVDAGVLVGISCTVTKHNYKEVEQEIDLAEKIGASMFMHYNFIPVGRGTEIMNMDITPQQREKLLKLLVAQNGKRKIALLSTAPQYARVCTGFTASSLTHFDVFSRDPELAKQTAFLADFVGGCGTGRLYLAMEPNGDLEPCVFIPKHLGNIKTVDFKKMWRTNPDLLAIRDRKHFIGHCAVCEFSSSCGGCRARSLGYYGDLIHADPGCMLNVKAWDKLKEKKGKAGKSKGKKTNSKKAKKKKGKK